MAILEGVNIFKSYGGRKGASSTPALNGIDLKLEKGEFVGVMGPSGSGKTTLLNLLSGIDQPSSGRILIAGAELGQMKNDELALFRRRKMGFVFQEFNLLDSLTLKENILLPLILDRIDPEEMERKVKPLLEFLGIEEIAGKYPYNVSGGEQQRAAVARAIINEPAVVFADEPTGNLDSHAAKAVMGCLEDLNARGGTVLMVTHDPYAASFSKRVVFIKDGRTQIEIVKKDDRKGFFERILDCLAVQGGSTNDL